MKIDPVLVPAPLEVQEQSGKPRFCKQADTTLAQLAESIAEIREQIQSRRFDRMGWSAMDTDGRLVPDLRDAAEYVQALFDDMVRQVASVKNYILLRGAKDTGPMPDAGWQGRVWLKKFLHAFQVVRENFVCLRTDVIYHTMAFLFIVGADCASNEAFNTLYGSTFAMAMVVIHDALPPTGDMIARGEYIKYLMQMRLSEYRTRPYIKRFLPGAATLGVAALVGHVAELFRLNLLRWDRSHALAIPQVRRVLEVFAFELQPSFDRGCYNLAPAFNK